MERLTEACPRTQALSLSWPGRGGGPDEPHEDRKGYFGSLLKAVQERLGHSTIAVALSARYRLSKGLDYLVIVRAVFGFALTAVLWFAFP